MAKDINNVFLVGNLTRDPEVRNIGTNSKVAKFSIATHDDYKDKSSGEWVNVVDYFDVDAFAWVADNVEKLSKGDRVAVYGSLKQDKWEQDGKARSKVNIKASKVEQIARVSNGNGHGNGQEVIQETQTEEDIPF